MIQASNNSNPYRQMVDGWGVYWFRYLPPFECPLCESNLCDKVNGPPFKREIAHSSWESDRVTHYTCPDCQGTILVR